MDNKRVKFNKQQISQLNRKDFYCINCGEEGHSFKGCSEPVTSYGIILISLDTNNIKMVDIKNKMAISDKVTLMNKDSDNIGINIEDVNDIELFCLLKNYIKFLLIRRKHTLGFLEFIRGRYSIDNVDGIIFLFKQMTPYEINKIRLYSFDELWDEVWGDNKNKVTYQNEYVTSKDKYNKLKNDENGYLSLNFYLDNVIPNWDCAEWGFPKGRRNMKETDINCAIREFCEESGLLNDDFTILENIKPIEEIFVGTNGINYRHVYYLALASNDKIPEIDANNSIQIHEIGAINYYNYEETIKNIRPYHTERIKIITCVFIYIINKMIHILKQYE